MAEEDGEERGRLVKSDSVESRWVYEYDGDVEIDDDDDCLLYTSPSPRDGLLSRMPSSA